eukprot:sb/3473983/
MGVQYPLFCSNRVEQGNTFQHVLPNLQVSSLYLIRNRSYCHNEQNRVRLQYDSYLKSDYKPLVPHQFLKSIFEVNFVVKFVLYDMYGANSELSILLKFLRFLKFFSKTSKTGRDFNTHPIEKQAKKGSRNRPKQVNNQSELVI